MNTISRRQMLGLVGLAGVSLSTGCRTNPKLEEASALRFTTSSTGLALSHDSNRHTLEGHPESAARHIAIEQALTKHQAAGALGAINKITSRIATVDELRAFHTEDYVKRVQRSTAADRYFANSRWAPYQGPFAFEAAATAAGTSLELLRAISDSTLKRGFAVTRPPGHHAGAGTAEGYCIFNNIAVAVKNLQLLKKRRIAIVDMDVHHGNGIQDAFYDDASVLYVSTHQNDWPYTGAVDKIGQGKGQGFNVNIPLPFGTGDVGLRRAYEELVLPTLRRFQPELIVVATGFDAHWRDYQGSFVASLTGLSEISRILMQAADELCGGRIGFILEGGYQLEVLRWGSSNLVAQLSGGAATSDPMGRSNQGEVDVTKEIAAVRKLHRL